MKKKYFILFLIFLYSSYSVYSDYFDMNPNQSVGDRLVNQMIDRITNQLSKHYPLKISGIGGSEDKDGIWLITVMYRHYGQKLDISQGRIIIVNIMNTYLTEINNDKEIRPYLKNYPFTFENFNLALIPFSEDRTSYYHPNLSMVDNNKNTIKYFTQDAIDHLQFTQVKTETYDEAFKIVKDSGQLLNFTDDKK